MELELLNIKNTELDYYPHYHGTRTTEIYKCPCGKGTVVYTHDDVPGNRDWFTIINCNNCDKKYKIKDYLTSAWSIVEKSKDD